MSKNGKVDASRNEFLNSIALIEGVYVPKFYEIEYNKDNTIKRIIKDTKFPKNKKENY